MSVNYDKLMRLLESRNMSLANLQKLAGYSGNISTRIRRNEYISLETIGTICCTLKCRVDDIVEFKEY